MNKTVAFFTLGCRVNQYETAAMEDLFKNKGYRKLKIRNVTDGHVDKFFWYSEFTNYDDNEYLQKYL